MAFDRLFSDFLGSPSAKGALGGAASGAVVSLLMNKKVRKNLGGTVLKLGGAAAVAGVGYYAYQQWQKRQNAAVAPSGGGGGAGTPSAGIDGRPAALPAAATASAVPPALPPVDDTLALRLLKTMIAAAQADGRIDETELARLEEAVHAAGLSPAEDAAVMAALNAPPSLEEIAQWSVPPAEAAELYGAAVMAADPDTAAEKFFLRRLASTLRLSPELAAEISASATGRLSP